MNKIVFIALLVIGVILLILGVNASESISSEFSRLFTGKPTDKAVWLLIGGILGVIIGLGGLARSSK